MNPFLVAKEKPDALATIIAESGVTMTYGELADTAGKIASAFRALGLQPGDHIALMLPNGIWYHPIGWGAWLAGLYWTPISTRLQHAEVAHILTDSDARLVVTAPEYEPLMAELQGWETPVGHWFTTGEANDRFLSVTALIEGQKPLETSSDTPAGADMLYSSGTTGRPKGILPKLGRTRDEADPLSVLLAKLYSFTPDSVYLCPAPLYHGSPLKYTLAIHRVGGTNVIMTKFDAEGALAAINRYHVTHSQWVPTMLSRMVRLDDDVKNQYDLSSHRVAVHAAAPCPPELKRQLIDWWGPIVHEFYAGSEAIGYTAIDTEQWLAHPGSVGRPVLGEIHIVGDDGEELPQGEIGQIYFGKGPQIAYHNDPEKTASVYHPEGWITMGDMGRLDEEGYLYLSDRKDFMIITGGVNVYPKEIEDLLSVHPAIADVAVFGVPNEEFGEEVKAVVQPTEWPENETAFVEMLTAHCRAHLSPIKVPRSFDLARELPRQENGKLYKKALRAAYLAKARA